jgi:SAM-dependent methyltransferase
MQNEALWQPSKYVAGRRGLRASRDTSAVAVQSRMAADLFAAFLEQALNTHARGRLLDLGCGTVPLYGQYKSLAEEVVCVDWGHSPHRVRHIDIEHDLTKPLPFEANRFDTIVLSDVLEHLPEPEQLWMEMARVLSPGGRVILNVPFLYWVHELPHDYYRYTEFALRRFAEQSGFRVLELTRIGGAAEVVTDIICKATRSYRFSGVPARALQWLCANFSRTGIGKRFQNRSGELMPLAYGIVAERE